MAKFHPPYKYVVTDGTTKGRVDITKPPFAINSWRPSAAAPKGGGTPGGSPLVDGGYIVQYVWGDVTDEFNLTLTTIDPDNAIRHMDTLRDLMTAAMNYTATGWNSTPVWVETQSYRESKVRYALVKVGAAPQDEFPFGNSFFSRMPLGGMASIWRGIPFIVNHGVWQSTIPGQSATALELSAVEAFEVGDAQNMARPEASSSDDAEYVQKLLAADTIDLATSPGSIGCTSSCGSPNEQNNSIGIRFRNIQIAQGTQITSATLFVTPSATSSANADVDVYAEDADDSAVFSTVGDFAGRALTSSGTAWQPSGWTAGVEVSVDVTADVQEVLDRGGWSQGNDLSLLILAWAGRSSAARTIYLSENGTVANHPRLVIEV